MELYHHCPHSRAHNAIMTFNIVLKYTFQAVSHENDRQLRIERLLLPEPPTGKISRLFFCLKAARAAHYRRTDTRRHNRSLHTLSNTHVRARRTLSCQL
jgi:hypothetical protein